MDVLTITQAMTQYNQNRDWDNDVAKAKLALQALRVIRMERGLSQTHAGSTLTFQAIESEIAQIKAFVEAADTSQNRASFTAARSRWV